MKISPSKSKANRSSRARAQDPLNYSLMNTEISQASGCKYLRIILHGNLSWADQVNYTVKKAWKELHFTMRIPKKGNSNTTCTSNPWIWGRVLGSVQTGTNKCVRQGPKEGGQICTQCKQSELGKFGVAYKVITHMCPLQSVNWGPRVETYWWQTKTTTLSEQGRSWGKLGVGDKGRI
jgi:hypothetical protein